MAVIAQNGFTVRRIINGKTIAFRLESNKAQSQIYKPGVENGYYPIYSTSDPNLVKPVMSVAGDSNPISHIGSITYTFTDQDGNTVKANDTANGGWLVTENDSTTKGIKIESNISKSIHALVVHATAVYTQPGTSIKTTITASLTIPLIENSGDAVTVAISYPNGQELNQNKTSVEIDADLVRGSSVDNTNVSYQWQSLSSGSWKDISGEKSRKLTVTRSMVTNSGSFRCKITDNDAETSKITPASYGYATIYDVTDPFNIDVFFPSGDSVTEDTPITVRFKIRQGSKYITASAAGGSKLQIWRYNSTGAMDTTWGTSGYKSATWDSTNNYFSTTISWSDISTGNSQGFEAELS